MLLSILLDDMMMVVIFLQHKFHPVAHQNLTNKILQQQQQHDNTNEMCVCLIRFEIFHFQFNSRREIIKCLRPN